LLSRLRCVHPSSLRHIPDILYTVPLWKQGVKTDRTAVRISSGRRSLAFNSRVDRSPPFILSYIFIVVPVSRRKRRASLYSRVCIRSLKCLNTHHENTYFTARRVFKYLNTDRRPPIFTYVRRRANKRSMCGGVPR
jgi:hypothetical protein